MPKPFTILGCGNGFNFCLPRLSNDETEGFQTLKNINLKKAMDFYWNMRKVKFSGHAKVDFHSDHFYNRSFEFSTEFDETVFDETGRETQVAAFADGNFLTEPMDRQFDLFYSMDERNQVLLMLKGPFLNDIDFDISRADISSGIYAFKIFFEADYALSEMSISTREPDLPRMLLRETKTAKFDTFPFPIYVSTIYNEYVIPDYEFEISDFEPQTYTAADY